MVKDSVLGIRLLAPMCSNLASTWAYLKWGKFASNNSSLNLSNFKTDSHHNISSKSKSVNTKQNLVFTSASRSAAVSFLPEKDSDIWMWYVKTWSLSNCFNCWPCTRSQWTWLTCVRVSPLVSGMTHQDQREVMRQMKEKVKRVGEMPSIRQRFGITFIANNVSLSRKHSPKTLRIPKVSSVGEINEGSVFYLFSCLSLKAITNWASWTRNLVGHIGRHTASIVRPFLWVTHWRNRTFYMKQLVWLFKLIPEGMCTHRTHVREPISLDC